MKALIFVILSFFSANTFGELACSKNGTDIYYLNGVDNTEDEAGTSTDALKKRIIKPNGAKIDSKFESNAEAAIKVDKLYNQTQGIVADIAETMGQVLKSGGVSDKVQSLSKFIFKVNPLSLFFTNAISGDRSVKNAESAFRANLILSHRDIEWSTLYNAKQTVKKSFDAGKKVIIVSHSQGNFFANKLYEEMSNDSAFTEFMPLFGNLQVASPASVMLTPNADYVTLIEDLLIRSIPGSMLANYDLDNQIPGLTLPEFLGHGFSTIYLGDYSAFEVDSSNSFTLPIKKVIADKLIKRAEFFPDNCDSFDLQVDPDQKNKTTQGTQRLEFIFTVPENYFLQRNIDLSKVRLDWEMSDPQHMTFTELSYNSIKVVFETDITDSFPDNPTKHYFFVEATLVDLVSGATLGNENKMASYTCAAEGCCPLNTRYVETGTYLGHQCITPPGARILGCGRFSLPESDPLYVFFDFMLTAGGNSFPGHESSSSYTGPDGVLNLVEGNLQVSGLFYFPTTPETQSWQFILTGMDDFGGIATATCIQHKDGTFEYTETNNVSGPLP
ncbi:MAG: hypothetical protein A2X86_03965 [Bdellovibrionales bacterium GWA2_49_15]|nr:MAG: hypothetical protein A2X86_03965 [Bdellovibrionales bacterium GWA2_49_15]HAZ12373.1 hypothetical protein [Bdellovibrionales bacterium]